MRPRLLFITPFYPSADGTGSFRRAHAVASALGKNYDVSMLAIPSRWHKSGTENLPGTPGVREVSVLPADAGLGVLLRLRRHFSEQHPRSFSGLFRAPLDCSDHTGARLRLAASMFAGQSFDVIHCFRLAMAPYALAIHRTMNRRPALHLDVDDIESLARTRVRDLHKASGHKRAALHESVNIRAYARWERKFFPRFDRLYVCSETDAERLRPAHRNVRILPNTVPVPATLPAAAAPGLTRMLFIGSLGHVPNSDGLQWFCREVLPALRRQRPCELVVAGLGGTAKFHAFLRGQPGVVFLGAIPDSAAAYADAHFTVVPLRAGGGTRIKILESFAQGRAVVSTAIGIEGIEAGPGSDHLRADTADEFVHACLRLIDDPELRATLARNAFERVSAFYSQDKLSERLA